LAITSIRNIALVLASSALVLSQSFGRTHREQAEALLKDAFGEASRVSPLALSLRSFEKDSLRVLTKQDFAGDTLHLLVASNGDKTLGYAIVDNVKGKDQLITYCVVVDEQLAVKDIEILAYREPYGGEVQNSSWLKQFFGKQPNDELRPGREIKNITGATISSRAITLGVKKLLALLHIIQARLPHNTLSTK